MKLRTVVKIAVTSSVLLFCAGFFIYSYLKLSAANERRTFDLYTLIPSSSSAVFVTDDVGTLMGEMEELTCLQDSTFLHVSKLLSSLKDFLYVFDEKAPHGLSLQMKRLLVSFHHPENERNQIFYFQLGMEDRELIDKFFSRHLFPLYPHKSFMYRGEEIRIYPMKDGDFLSCYLTDDFFVLSFQKRLVEEVINSFLDKRSLAGDSSFIELSSALNNVSNATIYARLPGMSGWTEFDLKLKGDFIYSSGVSHDSDSCYTFIDALRQQEVLEGFTGEEVPLTTFYLSRQGTTDWTSLLACRGVGVQKTKVSQEVQECNKYLSDFFIENTGNEMSVCIFHQEDSLQSPALVMVFPLVNPGEAGRYMQRMLETLPLRRKERRNDRFEYGYTHHKSYLFYHFPTTTLFDQLAGFDMGELRVYATFFRDRLLLSPRKTDILGYISRLEEGEVLAKNISYRSGVEGLSPTSHFILMADMETLLKNPVYSTHFVPPFFFRHAEFFRHFMLFLQLTCADQVIYPNIILQYKKASA